MPIEEDLENQIRAVCDVEKIDMFAPRESMLKTIHDADGILLTPRVRADAEFFDAAPKLKVLSTTSVGYDRDRGLPYTRCPQRRRCQSDDGLHLLACAQAL